MHKNVYAVASVWMKHGKPPRGGVEGVSRLEFVRIGDKLVDKTRVYKAIDRILDLRAKGFSQQEAADQVGIDRAFVSRLESLGEIRKGARVALVGFPVGNKEEIRKVAEEEGVDFVLLLNDAERWAYLRERSGQEVFNEIMGIITKLKSYDAVVFIGSDMRVNLVESILGDRVVGIEVGQSPIRGDRQVDPEEVRRALRSITMA
ncbi:MAG: transcriptional regulator [Firmicutes bacterium]|nr:transcriptional regulator [Bacillota bacterium]